MQLKALNINLLEKYEALTDTVKKEKEERLKEFTLLKEKLCESQQQWRRVQINNEAWKKQNEDLKKDQENLIEELE